MKMGSLLEVGEREVKIGRFQVSKKVTVKTDTNNNGHNAEDVTLKNYSTIKHVDIKKKDIKEESNVIKKLTNLFKPDRDVTGKIKNENDLVVKSSKTLKISRRINRFDVIEDSDDDNEELFKRFRGDESYESEPELTELKIKSSNRKTVRFADVLGLNLVEVKTFVEEENGLCTVEEDEPQCTGAEFRWPMAEFYIFNPHRTSYLPDPDTSPCQPNLCQHEESSCEYDWQKFKSSKVNSSGDTARLTPLFSLPIDCSQFHKKVLKDKVCLEQVEVILTEAIAGVVRVENVEFETDVVILWTTDEWKTTQEEEAVYIAGSSDGATDQFRFRLSPLDLEVGGRLQFCVRFHCLDTDYWDNNGGANFIIGLETSHRETCRSLQDDLDAGIEKTIA